MPDAEAPAEEAAPEGDAPAAEGAAGSGHQVRFVARTLDGMEVISAPIALTAGPGSAVQAKVSMAYWGHGSYLAGQTAYACAAAHGAEGATVKFFIEKDGSQVAELEAKVKDETAVAEWPVPADAAKGSKIRFRAETPWSKKTALAFAVTTLPAPKADAAEGGEAPAGKPAPAAAKPAPAAAKAAPAAAKPAPGAAKPAPAAAKPAPRAAAAKPAPTAAKAAPAAAKPAPAAAKTAAKPAPTAAKATPKAAAGTKSMHG